MDTSGASQRRFLFTRPYNKRKNRKSLLTSLFCVNYIFAILGHSDVQGTAVVTSMPITDMKFENGVFFAKESGHVDKADAELWAKALRQYAEASPTHIIALVDALEVTFVSSSARMVFADASGIEKLKAVSVATQDLVTTQTARVIGMLGERGRTHVFETLEQATRFARENANIAIDG